MLVSRQKPFDKAHWLYNEAATGDHASPAVLIKPIKLKLDSPSIRAPFRNKPVSLSLTGFGILGGSAVRIPGPFHRCHSLLGSTTLTKITFCPSGLQPIGTP